MVAEGNVGLAFGLVIGAGLCTTIGSTFAFCSSLANRKFLAGALGCSAGVMLYVSFAEIFTSKAVDGFIDDGRTEAEAYRYATACFFGGVLITWLIDKLVHRLTGHVHSHDMPEGGFDSIEALKEASATGSFTSIHGGHHHGGEPGMCCDPVHVDAEGHLKVGEVMVQDHVHSDVDEEEGEGKRASDGKPKVEGEMDDLTKMSLMTGIAIALHNFPEGLATFVAALADAKLGASIAIAIALHNIPEGICVAMPVYYATGSKMKGFWWSFLSGISEPIGGLFGYFILYGNNMSDTAYAILFGVVAGMMVYISMKELIPTAHKYDPTDAYVSNSVFMGMALMAASLLMFQV